VEITSEPGSYIVIGSLSGDVRFSDGPFSDHLLTLGFYLYAGSAFGPGGLRARINRHLKSETKRFWHFDYLKPLIHIEEIWYSTVWGNQECQFISILRNINYSSIPLTKFGSSDCLHGCPAHLVKFPMETNFDTLYGLLQQNKFFLHRLSVN
jgi:Uri superfamily endonuclease